MRYYRVKSENDQKQRLDGSILIANELYTGKEAEWHRIESERLAPVNIPKSRVYFFFGARFEIEV